MEPTDHRSCAYGLRHQVYTHGNLSQVLTRQGTTSDIESFLADTLSLCHQVERW
jgi:hypothetical protein